MATCCQVPLPKILMTKANIMNLPLQSLRLGPPSRQMWPCLTVQMLKIQNLTTTCLPSGCQQSKDGRLGLSTMAKMSGWWSDRPGHPGITNHKRYGSSYGSTMLLFLLLLVVAGHPLNSIQSYLRSSNTLEAGFHGTAAYNWGRHMPINIELRYIITVLTIISIFSPSNLR